MYAWGVLECVDCYWMTILGKIMIMCVCWSRESTWLLECICTSWNLISFQCMITGSPNFNAIIDLVYLMQCISKQNGIICFWMDTCLRDILSTCYVIPIINNTFIWYILDYAFKYLHACYSTNLHVSWIKSTCKQSLYKRINSIT